MFRAFAFFIMLIGAALPGRAAIVPPNTAAPGLLCRAAIAAAERAQAIPAQLMAAIGRVESGRKDEASGAWHPWPWTVNAEGQGAYFNTKAEAVAAVRAMQARGTRSIDVGCMQVNLMHHPDAFGSLEQAFDPAANAAYAARFLRQLFGQTGAWPKAVALYHSATPELGGPYAAKVMAAWPDETRHPATSGALSQAWAATTSHGGGGVPFQRSGSGSGDARGLDFYRATPIGLGVRAQGSPMPRAPFASRFRG